MAETKLVELTTDQIKTMLINELRNALTNIVDKAAIEPTPASAGVVEWIVYSIGAQIDRNPDVMESWALGMHSLLEKSDHRSSAPYDSGGSMPARSQDIWLYDDPLEISHAVVDLMFSKDQKKVFTEILDAMKPLTH